jgi:polysaccharide pyruvyl transferase WcaK-like protein
MRILLTGYYGFGNFGDDLLLVCSHAAARERFPGAEILVFANCSANLAGAPADAAFRQYVHRLLPAPATLVDWTHRDHFDLVVHGGGGTFLDDRPGRLRDALANRLVAAIGAPRYTHVAALARTALRRPARCTAGERVGFGIGLGPYVTSSRRLWREAEILGSFARLAVRDPESRRWATRLGLGARARQFTDLAFGVDRWLRAAPPAAPSPLLGIVLCDGKAGNADVLAAAAGGRLAGVPARFVFLDPIHDRALIRRVEREGHDVLVWDPWSSSLERFAAELARCTLLVSNRAHGAIAGACVGVPSVCIAADAKLRSVHGMLPGGSRLLEPAEIDRKLAPTVGAMLETLGELRAGLAADVATRKQQVREMVAYAFDG